MRTAGVFDKAYYVFVCGALIDSGDAKKGHHVRILSKMGINRDSFHGSLIWVLWLQAAKGGCACGGSGTPGGQLCSNNPFKSSVSHTRNQAYDTYIQSIMMLVVLHRYRFPVFTLH